MTSPSLATRGASYDAVGQTRPEDEEWWPTCTGYRVYDRTVRIGDGDALWDATRSAVLTWAVKTRSGFTIAGPDAQARVRIGDRYWVVAHVGPITVREPVQVVAVVDAPDRCGFAYGTLDGHPVAGEEAFIVHRAGDGSVWLTLRSLTRASCGRWRVVFPALLVAQRWYRRRYLQALTTTEGQVD